MPKVGFLFEMGKKYNNVFIIGARSRGRSCRMGRVQRTPVPTVYFGGCLQPVGNMAEQSCHSNTILLQMTSWHKDKVGAKKVRETKVPVRQAEGGGQSLSRN
jgi:hypothetical protein